MRTSVRCRPCGLLYRYFLAWKRSYNSPTQDLAIALGVFGALIVLLAIFGTCAVHKEDVRLLKWVHQSVVCCEKSAPFQFAGLTFLLIVILALIGIIAIVVYLVFRTKLKQNLDQSYIEGYTENESIYNATNDIQKEAKAHLRRAFRLNFSSGSAAVCLTRATKTGRRIYATHARR